MCPSGHRTDQVEGCVICEADTYLDGDSCMDCPTGFSTNGAEGGTSQAACAFSM